MTTINLILLIWAVAMTIAFAVLYTKFKYRGRILKGTFNLVDVILINDKIRDEMRELKGYCEEIDNEKSDNEEK